MEQNNLEVLARAKELILASPVMKYGITKEKVEEAFANCHVMQSREALEKEYNPIMRYNGSLKGFNRNHHCYFLPDMTPHVVIHEILHELSSEFDEKGHRKINGIDKKGTYSQVLLNEGIVDFLASKISGENNKIYMREKTVLQALEPLLVKQSGNPEILFKILLKDNNKINEFIQTFAKRETAYTLINEFEYMDYEKISLAMNEIQKRFNKKYRFTQLKARISSIFHRTKLLPSGENILNTPPEAVAIEKEEQSITSRENEFKSRNTL